jgi:3-oxoacyl-[acyl-carrier-protein] synthase II
MDAIEQHRQANREPVMITGVGVVSPVGNSFPEAADALLAGRSGVRSIDPGPFARKPVQFAGAVTDIPPPDAAACPLDPTAFAALPRLDQLCVSPIATALVDAGLASGRSSRRIGIVLGLGAEHLKAWEADYLADGGQVFAPACSPTLAQRLADLFGLTGPAVTTAAACASSGYAMALGRSWLAAGWVDACIVGGCDTLSPTSLAAFYNLRALSRRSDDPTKASRPFDRDRDGFVMGEGGAFFVLERQTDASRRAARAYGELAGVGMSSDASHMVAPCTDPVEAARAITMALVDSGVAPDEVDYVNAHAAGTPVGDAAEAGAIRLALGAAADRVPVSSTKSMSGHLVSGAAAFEAVACLAALDRQVIPPTLNLDHPDDACPLDHVPHEARPAPIRVAASNSFGFGGSNLCLVLRAA